MISVRNANAGPSGMHNENYRAITEGIQTFLADLGLVQYLDMFLMKGYDSEDDLSHLSDCDLDDMMITDPDHRQLILQTAAQHKPSEQHNVLLWLRKHGLEYYYVNFIRSELTSLNDITHMDLDEETFFDLEITLPGHKRRLQRAVSQLRKRQKTDVSSEDPLTFGRWAKPQCLQDGKFDFLCVDATIYSTKQHSPAYTIEFMVDTGSDVTTIRQEILDKLDLEVLGKIHSKGVHGSKTTNLYKAKLLIGNQELEIEVMGESYDSIGSRVVRHFRHYIDGIRHVWLRGNYSDKDTYLTQKSSNIPALCSQSQSPPESCSNTNKTPSSCIPSSSSSSSSSLSSQHFIPTNCKIPQNFNFGANTGISSEESSIDRSSIEVTLVQGSLAATASNDNRHLKDTSPDELDM
ncbi:hypothetical protein FSP39_016535 [Pinctada imbricata]|uniref:SAM domain-containing protein n=1 Tax=Pinctada imbricata TaxID=66713 RepID=A0AA88XJ63_PINIB|nr:hypothetical protein FSP39_016535 [Pinctada imbricata]